MADPPTDVTPPGIGTPPDNEIPAATAPPPTATFTKQFFLEPRFKWSLISVAAFTLIFFVTNVALAVFSGDPSDQVKGLIETCSTLYKMGFGAMVGLIGGKAV